jgi:release factor glutamine methyltransferase
VTVLEVIQRSGEFLAKRGIDSPRLQAELLLAHALGLPRMKLYLGFDRELTGPELDAVRGFVKRRGDREPLQHIVGSTSFCGFEIFVTPDVLVPRPETELLAARALKFLQSLGKAEATVLDFGTGSGCIAIAIAAQAPAAELHAVDLSEAALEVARRNAERHQVASRLHFHSGDGFDALPAGLRFDLIVSNPPYIARDEIDALQPEVRDHDPRLALDGGTDGLDFFRRLASEGGARLNGGGRLMVELGDGQDTAVRALFEAEHWRVEGVENDDTGRARILIAHREN